MSLPRKIKSLSANDLVSNCLWMLGGGAGRTAVALGSNLVLMWYLLPEEFGRFALTQATIGLVAGVVSLKINDIVIRESSHDLESGGKDLLFSALVVESILLCIGAVCLLWLVGLWNMWAGVLLFSTIVANWSVVGFAWYERSFQYKKLTLLESGAYLISHSLAVAGAVVGIGYAILYVRILLEALGKFCGLFFVGGMATFRLRRLSLHDWQSLYRRFRGIWLDGWLEHLFERLVIVLVGWMGGEKAAGYFFQAQRLANAPRGLFEPVTARVAYNYFSHRTPADRGLAVLGQALAIQLVFGAVLGLAVFFLASSLVPMIFGPQWEPMVPLLQAMVGVMIAFSPFSTLKAFFMAKKMMRPFILLGRGIQYVTLAGVTLVILVYQVPATLAMAVGISVGYIVGSLALFVFSRRLS